jgi:DNA-binding beta-propeller fold protein YncE
VTVRPLTSPRQGWKPTGPETRWLSLASAFVLILVMTVYAAGPAPAATSITGEAATLLQDGSSFSDSSFDVMAGTRVSLHWSTAEGLHFLVTSTLQDFSSPSVVGWPLHTHPSPRWDGTEWTTTAGTIQAAIPANAPQGAQYTVSLTTCDRNACSGRVHQATLTVPQAPTKWVSRPYQSDFPKVAVFNAPGSPFAATFQSSNDSLWGASEFSDGVTEIRRNTTSALDETVSTPARSPRVFTRPFMSCLTTCKSSYNSAMSESIVVSGGRVWLTFGGLRWLESAGTNHSEIVAFDPITRTFCTYLVPGNNNEVTGVATTGDGPELRVWFTESQGSGNVPSLDSFEPSSFGSGCSGRANEAYVLPESVRVLTWPSTGPQWPAQIAVDPTSQALWITDFNGSTIDGVLNGEIEKVDISDPAHPTVIDRFDIPSSNPSSFLGPKPWYILAPPDSNYVYAIDNGDAEIIRINKTTDVLDEVPLPLTSDIENGFGLAIHAGRLYFTLADDGWEGCDWGCPPEFGASTFGYVSLSSWPDNSAPTSGVIYTGLHITPNKGSTADYRGLAVSPTGQVGITNQYSMILLTP